jgi:hypothetical protein
MSIAVSPLPLSDGFPVLAAEPPQTTKSEKELYLLLSILACSLTVICRVI